MPTMQSSRNRFSQEAGLPPRPRTPVRGWFRSEHDHGQRSSIVIAFFLLCAVVLVARLVDLQVVQAKHLSALAKAEHLSSVVVPAQRGQIYDSQGNLLVGDTTVYDVFADPALVPAHERAAISAKIAKVLGISSSTVEHQLALPLQFAYLDKGVSSQTKDALENLNIDGLGVLPREEQTYVNSPIKGMTFAANLLGFVNANGQGQYGLEQYYNSILQGKPGRESAFTDLQGNPIMLSNVKNVAPKNGTNLMLGLDSTIQYWAEVDLMKGIQYAHAQSGMVLVMDTHSGSIKAWAEEPTYNAAQYATTPEADFKDIAISNRYEPGSIMKIVTFAGGLNVNAITPGYTFNEGPVTIEGQTIHDWDNKAHGMITMQKVLDMSLNDGAIKVGELMGDNAFYDNLANFGIGAPTGIDLANEVYTPLPAQSTWSPLRYAEATFGQSVVATPVEMLAALNAVANGGVWVQPHVVDQFVNPNTGAKRNFVPITRRVISAQADATLRTMMTGVIANSDGEGFDARIPGWVGYEAGKTGTASVAVNGRYSNSLVIVSFGGFLPSNNPKFTMLVVLNYPNVPSSEAYGSLLAAPVWKQLAEVIINQWHLTP